MKVLHSILLGKYDSSGRLVGTMYRNDILTVGWKSEDTKDDVATRLGEVLTSSLNDTVRMFSELHPGFTFHPLSQSLLHIIRAS